MADPRRARRLVVFDVESNGLHGPAFAVGAWVFAVGRSLPSAVGEDSFFGRCPIAQAGGDRPRIDPWVKMHVLPALEGRDLTHPSPRAMRDDFWKWLMHEKAGGALVVADVGYPVEARFLLECQADDPSRARDAPYPLHELGTLLLAAGVDPDVDRLAFAEASGWHVGQSLRAKHDPMNDAYVSGLCALSALEALRDAL